MLRTENVGVCETCREHVPAEHVIRDNQVYLIKNCPACGKTEALVSSDAARWQKKREICGYNEQKAPSCDLNCRTCSYQGKHNPRMVFLDITNRCNMNCPICIANIPGMGFEFNPPLQYFERVFDGLAQWDPVPSIKLFGGEPTVRKDMFDIIEMARKRGLRVGIVTNGLKLADEEYCKKVCESHARLLIAFDGRSPEIYERLRKNPGAYEKKIKALENLRKYSNRQHTIMCCVARKINDKFMGDLIEFCHENQDLVSYLHLIPLTETWEEGEFASEISTTTEDVEEIINEAVPGGKVDFMPSGIVKYLGLPFSFFGKTRPTFGGVHPNCESATMLLADEDRYRPISDFLKRPADDIAADMVARAQALESRLAKLDRSRRLHRWRGRLLVGRKLIWPLARDVKLRELMKGNWLLSTARLLGGLVFGRKLKDQLVRHTRLQGTLGMLILPFEASQTIEGERMVGCPSGFAYEDPDDGEIKSIPVCAWGLYQKDLKRRIAEKYAALEQAPAE